MAEVANWHAGIRLVKPSPVTEAWTFNHSMGYSVPTEARCENILYYSSAQLSQTIWLQRWMLYVALSERNYNLPAGPHTSYSFNNIDCLIDCGTDDG